MIRRLLVAPRRVDCTNPFRIAACARPLQTFCLRRTIDPTRLLRREAGPLAELETMRGVPLMSPLPPRALVVFARGRFAFTAPEVRHAVQVAA